MVGRKRKIMMFDHFAFFSREMGMLLASLLVNFIILSAFQVQGSTGFNLHSLEATARIFHHKVGALDLKFPRTIRPQITLLQNDPPVYPMSSVSVAHQTTQGTIAVAPQPSTFHHPLHIYHRPAKAPYQHKHLNESFEHHFRKPMKDPATFFYKNHWRKNRTGKLSPERHDQLAAPTSSWQGEAPLIAPSPSPFSLSEGKSSAAPVPSPAVPASHFRGPAPQPIISPASSSRQKAKRIPSPSPILIFPPPPPNQDCTSLLCSEPLTYSPAGSPCGCVWPVEVSLRLNVSLYTFFPLVSELANEISASLLLNRSQVRIMGANAANQQLEKTVVLINLVPLGERFNATTAFSIYRKFWKREVFIRAFLFGRYEVVYVHYPGLPPSPPSLPTATATISNQRNPGTNSDGRTIKPLGVDVPRRKKNGIGRNVVIVIVSSSITIVVLCIGFIWLLLLKCGCCTRLPQQNPHVSIASHGKPSGGAGSLMLRSRPSSSSMSFSSSILAYTGTAKVFSISDIERATNNFDASRIIGEGGFGIVYRGILDDATKVAVKVLKRDDQQGSREFLAEVEMLSRLHHRNLVTLIGICTEAHCRCLVYELVPNGSVESHLHGVDNDTSPLDWYTRMKIALGAARGLAYLHEDSSPRVIHRDFKSSNILLEKDFTPKVSDFGLARTAQEERNKHISTHVMGTFGYLAPEYAMTGHLLVKSDVYSYGVVLLELLTGRKPVDLSQPPGQENLVAWARPLLTTNEGLELIIDPALMPNVSFDSVARFAAIASMCVQPEVSHRPFMGEVVQALKLVCNEFDETRDLMSRSCSQEEFSIDIESKHSRISGDIGEALEANYTAFHSAFDHKIALSTANLASEGIAGLESESFRRQFNSAPLKQRRKRRFWERLKGLSGGSMSEHGYSSIFRQGNKDPS